MHGHTGTSLIAPGKIVTQPGDITWESRVDTANGYENASINDAWHAAAGGRDGHNEANSNGAHGAKHKGGALASAIREPGHRH